MYDYPVPFQISFLDLRKSKRKKSSNSTVTEKKCHREEVKFPSKLKFE